MLKNTIEKIKQSKYKENIYVWSNLLVRELIEKDYNLAIQWVSNCIQSYLFEFESPRYIELNEYVQKALESEKVLNASQYKKIARKIWYMGNRDNAQCAVYHLWCAIAELKLEHDNCGMKLLALAFSSLFSDKIDFHQLDLYIRKAIRIYQEYEDKMEIRSKS